MMRRDNIAAAAMLKWENGMMEPTRADDDR